MKRVLSLIFGVLLFAGCQNDDIFATRDVYANLDGLVLNKSELTNLITGESRKLILSFTPAEAQSEVDWSSSDEAVATVDQKGVVTAHAQGTAVITVKSRVNASITAQCNVAVERSSGISVTDVLLGSEVTEDLVFLRGDPSREYTYFAKVYNSLDTRVTLSSTNPTALDIRAKEIDGIPGFELIPGDLGVGEIVITSVANPEMQKRIPFSLITVSVTAVKLSFNADGSNADNAIAAGVTIGQSQKLRVVFETDNADIKIPENKLVTCSSNDTSVATVQSTGTIDPATNSVFFVVTMVDNSANVPTSKSAIITVTSADGGFSATFTASAKQPAVESLVLNQTLSRPVVAGDTIIVKFKTIPADAYMQSVTWSSPDATIATVSADGIVTIVPDFAYDPTNCTATEILIEATSTDTSNGTVKASCKIRPYQYVPATSVMVTDQWGNRIAQHANSTNSSKQSAESCAQYCCGGGKNKTDVLSDVRSWGRSIPSYDDAPEVGCIPVYLTATPVPYTYPTIADPNQEFYWGAYSNSRFAMADPSIVAAVGVSGYNSALGYSQTYDKNDGKKSDLLKGRTILFYTGHGASGTDINNIRLWRVVPDDPNDGTFDKTSLMLFRTAIHTNVGKDDVNNNPSLKVDGGGKIFNAMRPATPKLNDAALWPWPNNAPNPRPTAGPAMTPEVAAKIRTQKYPGE